MLGYIVIIAIIAATGTPSEAKQDVINHKVLSMANHTNTEVLNALGTRWKSALDKLLSPTKVQNVKTKLTEDKTINGGRLVKYTVSYTADKIVPQKDAIKALLDSLHAHPIDYLILLEDMQLGQGCAPGDGDEQCKSFVADIILD
ncbi:uncharacterized protein LOC129596357 isoform X2 [Paramacrobiotus metropolitanus]|uniref:uncharacterized protein LOC129596357 isoform X2 n=1 Tax=Paramacrobiotus metropolitanus TaxID=2943436 RepID=UPI002445F9AC|nr:uncharacterized protein LOC129596357 isoform X2 [Paramacrobiotus metropolitanus]